MRLEKFLNESVYEMDDIIETLKRDCQPYINDVKRYYKKQFLCTGRKDNVSFSKKRVRKDRKPRDTPLEIHEYIDGWFDYEFGIKFRSNSIFAVFNIDTAEDYGTPYWLFPIGKYEAISSSVIDDLYSKIEDIVQFETDWTIKNIKKEWNGLILDSETKERIFDSIEDKLDKAKYEDIRKSFDIDSEIMVHCKEYYILRMEAYDYGERELLGELTS